MWAEENSVKTLAWNTNNASLFLYPIQVTAEISDELEKKN